MTTLTFLIAFRDEVFQPKRTLLGSFFSHFGLEPPSIDMENLCIDGKLGQEVGLIIPLFY